jgi:type IV secretory pathway TrbD component
MLQPIADGLWGAEHDLFLPGGVCFRGRMTVVRLDDGGLLLHSPVPVDDALAAEIDALGTVAHLVGPNLFHHLHLRGAAARWPDARLWGAPGLPEKRGNLRFSGTVDAPDLPWRAALRPTVLQGCPRLNETVFLHAASGTLLCTDLVFHIQRWPNFATSLVLWMTGTRGRLAMSRSWRPWRRACARSSPCPSTAS